MTQETIIVTGFGRCGTTLLMKMLDAGGMAVVADSRASFESNIFARPDAKLDWSLFAGKAIKVLDPQRWRFTRTDQVRFILLTRDPAEQAKSQAKLLRMGGLSVSGSDVRRIRSSLRKDYKTVLEALWPHFVLKLSFEDVVSNPERNANLIGKYLGGPMDVNAMAAAVVRRSPRCLPDMNFEIELVEAEISTTSEVIRHEP